MMPFAIRPWAMAAAMFLACAAVAFPAQPPFLEPTELLFRHEDKLCQAVLALVEPLPGAKLAVASGSDRRTLDVASLPRFMGRVVVPVPISRVPQRVEVELAGTDRKGAVELAPSRQWEVFIVPHTHLDVGFTDLQERVWESLAKNLNEVIDICERTSDWPDESQFHWTIEGTSLFDNFARRFPRERVEALVRLIREGRVELTATPMGLLTELCGPESLVRSTYAARRVSDQHGIRIDTAMINDIPGYTWALPQIWSQSGVRYANLRGNGIRAKFVWDRPGAVPRPFRWQSPDGSEIVCWYTDSYREANFLRQEFPEKPSDKQIRSMERMLYESLATHLRRTAASGYDREIIQLRMGGDNLTATDSVCHWVRYWNQRWAYPKLRIATSRQFFHALENDSRPIPVYRGDIPDWWADGAASSAKQTGDVRIAHDQAVALETLYSLPGGPAAGGDAKAFSEIFKEIELFTEHTWGASSKWYGKDPSNVEQQWAVKRGYVERATAAVGEGRRGWSRAVQQWARPAADSVVVWNSLSWPRSGLVEVEAAQMPLPVALRGPRGELVPTQKMDERRWCFIARDVPPVGYAAYTSIEENEASSRPSPPEYLYELDASSGLVRQVRHRPTGQALVAPSSRFGFNQYVYEHGKTREKIFPAQIQGPRSPADKKITLGEMSKGMQRIRGPVFEQIVTYSSGPQATAMEQTCTTYAGLDRLDIVNRVDKVATESVEAVYFAFPFNIEEPKCRLEIPFTCMRPGIDQLRYSAADFYSVYHWVELWGKTGGLLWATVEAPVVVFGDLWPQCWRDEPQTDNGLLFSYVMNNYWFTNYRQQQGGELTFRYAIRAFEGSPDSVRSFRFGAEVGTPLLADVIQGQGGTMPKTGSWLSVEPDHVMLTILKVAEDNKGWIVRLLELGVRDCTARLRLPPGHWTVSQADPAERQQRSLFVMRADRPTVEVAIRRSGLVTLRLQTPSE